MGNLCELFCSNELFQLMRNILSMPINEHSPPFYPYPFQSPIHNEIFLRHNQKNWAGGCQGRRRVQSGVRRNNLLKIERLFSGGPAKQYIISFEIFDVVKIRSSP